MSILEVKDLCVFYRVGDRWLKAVRNVFLDLERGEALGIIGETGCGKTSIALSIMKLLPRNGKIFGGRILFDGVDLANLSENEMRNIRGNRISMIFQGAMNALDPLCRVGDSLAEALRAHKKISRSEASEEVKDLFEIVGLSPEKIENYPHQLSGGMRQRVLIAASLLHSPDLVNPR